MSVLPDSVQVGQNLIFSITGTEGDLWIKDTWTGGVNCTGLVWPDKTCKATANGTFQWTHKWKKCSPNNTKECSAECSKTETYTIGSSAGTPTPILTPTPSGNCVSQLQATCSADNKQVTFKWKSTEANGYILRVDHEPSNVSQCLNTVTKQNVGWYCPASSQCVSASCDDKYIQFSAPDYEVEFSRTVPIVSGASYKWSVEALSGDYPSCRVDATQSISCAGQGGVTCGPMDIDGNGNLDLIDFASFANIYRRTCTSTTGQNTTCGAQDTNPANGVVDLYDFNFFSSHYRKSDCQ